MTQPGTYEQRLRAAACALAHVVRREFPRLCKDPEKVAELLAIEDLLQEPRGGATDESSGNTELRGRPLADGPA